MIPFLYGHSLETLHSRFASISGGFEALRSQISGFCTIGHQSTLALLEMLEGNIKHWSNVGSTMYVTLFILSEQ